MTKSVLVILGLILFFNSYAEEDNGVTVQGSETEDVLSKMKVEEESPYFHSKNNQLEESKNSNANPLLPNSVTEEVKEPSLKNEFTGNGFTMPGTFEKQENYLDIDTDALTKRMRKHNSMAVNLTYIKDSYSYQSPNDIVSRTITQGYKHVQTGFLLLRADNYFFQSDFLNLHWSLGGGLALNYARGIFITGEQSDAQFRLWEIPLDAGIGFEIPLTKWMKMSGTAGPSVLTLIQNRSDLTAHEPGKNKAQFGFGGFGSAQFKINLTGFSDSAYESYTTNQISNVFLNLEARYHSYAKYLDSIKISGTSFGAGVTFEFL